MVPELSDGACVIIDIDEDVEDYVDYTRFIYLSGLLR